MNHDQTPRWDGDQNEENNSYDVSSADESAQESTQSWLYESHDDDEEAESADGTKKKKRFRKLFKRLFPAIASKEEGEPLARSRFENFFSPQKEPETTPTNVTGLRSEAEQHNEPSGDNEQTSTTYEAEGATGEAYNVQDNEYEYKTKPEPIEQSADVLPELNVPIIDQANYSNDAPPSPPPIFDQTIYTNEKNPKSTMIDKIKAPLALVTSGAILAGEYFGRRRERKLRKRAKNLEKQSLAQKKELLTQKKKEEELTEKINRQDKKIDQLESISKHPVKVEEKPVLVTEYITPAISRLEAPDIEAIPTEKENRQIDDSQEQVNQPHAKEAIEAIKIKELEADEHVPDEPLEFIEKKKEKEQNKKETHSIIPEQKYVPREPVEKRKEIDFSRHEFRDEPTKGASSLRTGSSGQFGPAVAIGSVLAEKNIPKPPNNDVIFETTRTMTPNKPPTSIYQQSISAGMALGVIITAVIALYTLL